MLDVIAIYENGIYREGDIDFTVTNSYRKIFFDALDDIRELEDNEIMNSLQYFEDEDIWKAEIWNTDTTESTYIDVDQSIFREDNI